MNKNVNKRVVKRGVVSYLILFAIIVGVMSFFNSLNLTLLTKAITQKGIPTVKNVYIATLNSLDIFIFINIAIANNILVKDCEKYKNLYPKDAII